jgi:hypothetical protein
MKHWSKLAAALAVFALLLGLFAVAYADQGAAPARQATATPAPKAAATTAPAAAPEVNTDEPTIPALEEWKASPHADAESESFRHWDEEDPQEVPTSCAKCHSSAGYRDFLGADGSEAGVVDEAAPVNTVVDCVACHNSATIAKTSVVFPSGIEVTGLGDESRCMECHQGRESKISVDRQITETFKLTDDDLDVVVKPIVATTNGRTVTTTFGFRNVHYFAAAATQYGTLVKGGYEYEGMSYDGKFQHPAPFNTCSGCHDPHALEMNLEACATCHTGVETLDDIKEIRMQGSLMDYDGDGDREEGVQSEFAGLQEKLLEAIQAYASEVADTDIGYDASTYPYFFGDANTNNTLDQGERAFAAWTPRLLKAAYNYQVAGKDPGAFAHNAKYVIQLMHDSIADLNTELAEAVDIEDAARNDAGHFDGTSMAFRDWDDAGAVPAGCAKCHSSTGLPEFIRNAGTVAVTWNGQVQTVGTSSAEPANGFACTTCHNSLEEYTVHPVKGVPFPSGRTVSFSERDDKGAFGDAVSSNLCLECHQGRASTQSVNLRLGDREDDEVPEAGLSFINVHYFAAGASLFGNDAQGAYQYADKEYVGRFMHVPGFDTCAGCHDPHALNVQMDKCVTCHAGVEEPSAIRLSKDDLDGDDDVEEGAAGEIETLQEKLFAAIQDYAENVAETAIAYDDHAYPYFFADANGNGEIDEGEGAYSTFTPRLLKAAYNYQYSQKDPGIYAHNLAYAAQILYDSLEDLGNGGIDVDLTGLVRPEAE